MLVIVDFFRPCRLPAVRPFLFRRGRKAKSVTRKQSGRCANVAGESRPSLQGESRAGLQSRPEVSRTAFAGVSRQSR
jgi:hypothetical protein